MGIFREIIILKILHIFSHILKETIFLLIYAISDLTFNLELNCSDSIFLKGCFDLFFVPSFVQSLNAGDAKMCQKRGERTRKREKSIPSGEENRERRRGANECLGGPTEN